MLAAHSFPQQIQVTKAPSEWVWHLHPSEQDVPLSLRVCSRLLSGANPGYWLHLPGFLKRTDKWWSGRSNVDDLLWAQRVSKTPEESFESCFKTPFKKPERPSVKCKTGCQLLTRCFHLQWRLFSHPESTVKLMWGSIMVLTEICRALLCCLQQQRRLLKALWLINVTPLGYSPIQINVSWAPSQLLIQDSQCSDNHCRCPWTPLSNTQCCPRTDSCLFLLLFCLVSDVCVEQTTGIKHQLHCDICSIPTHQTPAVISELYTCTFFRVLKTHLKGRFIS